MKMEGVSYTSQLSTAQSETPLYDDWELNLPSNDKILRIIQIKRGRRTLLGINQQESLMEFQEKVIINNKF